MKHLKRNFAGFLASVFLVGCNVAEKPATAPEQDKPEAKEAGIGELQKRYAEEVLALKAKINDRAALEEEVKLVNARYRFQDPGPDPRSEAAILAEAEKAIRNFQEEGAAEPLGKGAAAAQSMAYKRVKQYDLYHRQATWITRAVQIGQTIQVTARGIGSCDPFVVLFYKKLITGDQHNQTIATYDDDGGGGLNSNAVWTNNTGTWQDVSFLVFSANGYQGIGRADVEVRITANPLYTFWSTPVYAAGPTWNNFGTCNSGYRTQIQTTAVPSGYLFAMDSQRKRATFTSLHSTSTTGGWIPNGFSNFVVNFNPTNNYNSVFTMQQWDDCI